MDYRQLAYQTAQKYGIDPDLFVRQIQAESAFRPDAVSSAGAIGLGQLMPATAKELGVDPNDPVQNLEGAARYMKQQLDRFGDPALALAAYNAGPSRVAKANGVPNITETQNYVAKILGGKGGAAMAQEPQKPQGLLSGLLGGQGIGGALGLSPEFSDKLAMAVMAGSGDARLQPLIAQRALSMKERRAEAKELKSTNKTLAYLKARADAGDSLARAYHDAVATGTLKGGAAVANYLKDSQTGTKDTALIRQALAAGLKQGTPEFQRYILSGGDIYSQETALLASLPKPEKGMRYQFDKDETGAIINYRLVPITGSEADKEAEKIQQAAEAQRSAQTASGMVVLQDIGKAIDIAKENPVLSTGFVGGILKNIGGTAAKDLSSLTTTIKANIGFDRLQRMREESPTGGALGQVAVQELEALQSTLGNLDNSQSNEQVVANLERLEAQYRKSMREIYNAALADQQKGLVNKRTGQLISPMDYFSEADIAMLSGQTQAAPAQTQPRTDDDLLKKYGG